MYRQIRWATILLAVSVMSAAAQQAPASKPAAKAAKPAAAMKGAAGDWNGKSMIGAEDSVVGTYTWTIAADSKSATIKFPNRDALEARVVAMGGDSIVTEVGPYPSIVRPGETVNLLRTVGHVKGNSMTGTFEAHYAKG